MGAEISPPSTICPSQGAPHWDGPLSAGPLSACSPCGGMRWPRILPSLGATGLSHCIHIIIGRTAHYYQSIIRDINSSTTTKIQI